MITALKGLGAAAYIALCAISLFSAAWLSYSIYSEYKKEPLSIEAREMKEFIETWKKCV
jgi:hypothetical protein